MTTSQRDELKQAVAEVIWRRHYHKFYPSWEQATLGNAPDVSASYRGVPVDMSADDTQKALAYVLETAEEALGCLRQSASQGPRQAMCPRCGGEKLTFRLGSDLVGWLGKVFCAGCTGEFAYYDIEDWTDFAQFFPPAPPRETEGQHTKPTFPVGVSVLITNADGQVLLGRRINCSAAGMYSTPGGRIEPYEDMFQCAIRETLEEVGVVLVRDNLRMIGVKEHFRFGNHYIMFYLHAANFIGNAKNTEPDKCEGWAWYNLDAIPQPCTEPAEILLALKPEGQREAAQVDLSASRAEGLAKLSFERRRCAEGLIPWEQLPTSSQRSYVAQASALLACLRYEIGMEPPGTHLHPKQGEGTE